MSEDRQERPSEMPAVRTTIVGGRPPGSGVPVGSIPRGVEILIQKAAVDPEFKALLLEKRSAAAAKIELTLSPAEAEMLDTVPAVQLEAIINTTKVPENTRRWLIGGAVTVAALAALGLPVCMPAGIRPNWEGQSAGARPAPGYKPQPGSDTQPAPPSPEQPGNTGNTQHPTTAPSRGIRPDRPAGSR
jgi:hypothetical protein